MPIIDSTWSTIKAGDKLLLVYHRGTRMSYIAEVRVEQDGDIKFQGIYIEVTRILHIGAERTQVCHEVGERFVMKRHELFELAEKAKLMKEAWEKLQPGDKMIYAYGLDDSDEMLVAEAEIMESPKRWSDTVQIKITNRLHLRGESVNTPIVGEHLPASHDELFPIDFSPLRLKAPFRAKHVVNGPGKPLNIGLAFQLNRLGNLELVRYIGQVPADQSTTYFFSSKAFFTPWGHRMFVDIEVKFEGDDIVVVNQNNHRLWPLNS